MNKEPTKEELASGRVALAVKELGEACRAAVDIGLTVELKEYTTYRGSYAEPLQTAKTSLFHAECFKRERILAIWINKDG